MRAAEAMLCGWCAASVTGLAADVTRLPLWAAFGCTFAIGLLATLSYGWKR